MDVWEWWEALPDVRKALSDVREWSGGHLGCPGVFGRPSQIFVRPFQMSGSCREALTDIQEWSGGPSGCPGVFWRSSRMSRSGRETLPDV